MTHNHTSLHHISLIKFCISSLLYHLCKSTLCYLWIIWCIRIARSHLTAYILKIWQKNIHNSIKCLNCLNLFISARVIDNWNCQSTLPCSLYALNDNWQIMACRHKIDIICLFFLKLHVNLAKPILCNCPARMTKRNFSILTIYTA